MDYSFYHLIHLLAVFSLVGCAAWAISNPQAEERKTTLMYSGIAGLVALVSGFGLIVKINSGFPIWVIVKLLVWVSLIVLVGKAYKKQEMRKQMLLVLSALVVLAITMVALKPF